VPQRAQFLQELQQRLQCKAAAVLKFEPKLARFLPVCGTAAQGWPLPTAYELLQQVGMAATLKKNILVF